MENEKSKIVTFEDLAKYTKDVVSPLINENLVKFAEDTLLPSIEQMFDDFRLEVDGKFNAFGSKTDKRFESIDQQLINIQAELSDIKSEISAIKGELNNIKVKLERLEKMVEGDAKMYVAEIAELKEANQEITKRLLILENKRT